MTMIDKAKIVSATALTFGLLAAAPLTANAMTVDQHAKSMVEERIIVDQRTGRTQQDGNWGFEDIRKDSSDLEDTTTRGKVTPETR